MSDEEKNNIDEITPEAADETAKLLAECAEYKQGWQRALADYQNLQKEVAARRAELVQMSEQQILEEFIPVYDNFKLAYRLQTTDYSPEQQKWVDGIGYIMKQFGDILKAHGVEEIKTAGEKFDARWHEAVGALEPESQGDSVQGKIEAGTILREVGGGYKMGGRVIKPAKVIITK